MHTQAMRQHYQSSISRINNPIIPVIKCCLLTIGTVSSVCYVEYGGVCIAESCKVLCTMEIQKFNLSNFLHA